MSRWKQYLIFGGAVFVAQTDFVQGVLHSNLFYTVLYSFIGLALAVAVVATVYARKKM